MVWINYQHFNETGKKGYIGGGSMCMCSECKKKRADKKERIKNNKTAVEITQEARCNATAK